MPSPDLQLHAFGRIVDLGARRDLSAPIVFGRAQARGFGLTPASSVAVVAGAFVGDVRRGGSCNCEAHVLTPHADGTHTEGPGHLMAARVPVHVAPPIMLAAVIRVRPVPLGDVDDDVAGNHRHDDMVVDADSVAAALDDVVEGGDSPVAVVIATDVVAARRDVNFSGTNPPYLTVSAAAMLRSRGVEHLLVDLPSIDREDDGGLLGAHRAFFGMPQGVGAALATGPELQLRDQATVTELVVVDDDIAVGLYALFLQMAPIVADAVPSRPVIAPFAPFAPAVRGLERP